MQWKGYLPYIASWEPEEGILPRCEELFNWRSPDVAIIPENECSFRVAVERHLKSRSRLPLRLVFGNVFRFLFAGKGVSRDRRTFFWKRLFRCWLVSSWVRSWVDSHGQGMKVFYPMTVKTYISWSPKKYKMGMGGISTLLPRAYQENISFDFTEVALNDWIMKSHELSRVQLGL